ncbi:excisionase family DNA-binding protein [Streptomyces mesophilus]
MKEVAGLLNCSESHVRRLIASGQLSARKIGRSYRIDWDAVRTPPP